LRGTPFSAATGTSGTQPRSAAPTTVATDDLPTSGTYRLVNAKPASADSGGTGANGAGGSGGPLVSGETAFDLDALPAGARDNVNKQVRITGRLAANETAGEPRTTRSSAPTATSPSAGSAAAGTSGSGVGVPGSTPSAAGAPSSPAPTSGAGSDISPNQPGHAGNRRVIVETVQVVADKCSAQ